jgi:hypothetical protein
MRIKGEIENKRNERERDRKIKGLRNKVLKYGYCMSYIITLNSKCYLNPKWGLKLWFKAIEIANGE